ncbi:MAG: BamA/TamA family outer membrane protein [Sphingomonadaceae bacterium]|nr:BamA/TamA family outer membrane protein [Sphingomonadaceae bacterium]
MTVRPPRSGAYLGSLAAALTLLPSAPLAAQQPAVEVSDEVRSLPEGEGARSPVTAAPMTEIDDFGVAWPDMGVVGDTEVGAAAGAPTVPTDQRYAVSLAGLDGLDSAGAIAAQFDTLSQLREGEGDRVVAAQIDRRLEEDEALLRRVMRANGYYDAQVSGEIRAPGEGETRIAVVLSVEPGPLYRFDRVEVPGLAEAGAREAELREQFPVEAGDPVDATAVTMAEANLAAQLGERGYPFAEVGEEQVTIDHATDMATMTLPVTTGGERDFGQIRVTGEDPLFDAEHVDVIARFERGDDYATSMVDDLRRALIQTGLVARVELTPTQSPENEGEVDIVTQLAPAPPRTIAGSLGYGTGEGFRAEASWEHRNLFPPEGALQVRGIAGTQEQYAGLTYRRSNFLERDHVLSGQIYAGNATRDAYDARTIGVTGTYERVTNLLWQKQWVWSVGAEVLASDERNSALGMRQTFFIGALPLRLGFDSTNDLLNPEEGFRLSGFISPEVSFRDGTGGYARIQLDGSAYYAVAGATVLAGRLRLGTIQGASLATIAPSRRFYVGGGGSVRGYGYQEIGPQDALGDPTGGLSLFEASLEARVRFGDFGVVPFIDAGNLYLESFPDFTGLQYGAGLGLRYYTSFGPIRIDVGTPLNPRPGDPLVAVYVSLGQAF